MIKIDEERKEIVFIPDETAEEHPPQRSFPLLSAYVCPRCKRILAAYFQGYLSASDIGFYQKESHYVIGSVPGGHYLKLENHQGFSYYGSENCPWELFTGRGVVENLRAFARNRDIAPGLVAQLADKIGGLKGFILIEDVCGKDGPMLLFSEDALLGEIRREAGFEAYWEAKQGLGAYLVKLAGGEGS